MKTELARFNLIKQQIQPWDVDDPKVLELLGKIPRERFVPQAYEHFAFADIAIPIGHGQQMQCPREEARILQALALQPNDRVLEVGTGTGFLTACLAHQAKHVTSVEIIPELADTAKTHLQQLNVHNVNLITGDGLLGCPHEGPYDVMVVTGAYYQCPSELIQQLKVEGRLFAIIGHEPMMEACLITKIGEEDFRKKSLFETFTPHLIHAEATTPFTL